MTIRQGMLQMQILIAWKHKLTRHTKQNATPAWLVLGDFIAGAESTGPLKSCERAAASKPVSWNTWINDKQTRNTNAGCEIWAQINRN